MIHIATSWRTSIKRKPVPTNHNRPVQGATTVLKIATPGATPIPRPVPMPARNQSISLRALRRANDTPEYDDAFRIARSQVTWKGRELFPVVGPHALR